MSSKDKDDLWLWDSGRSRHMTENSSIFLQRYKYDGGNVTFGDNARGHIVGVRKIGKGLLTTIENVYLVKGLKHNLLSVSQFCDEGHQVVLE